MHDIRDVEAYGRRLIQRSRVPELNYHEYEELLSWIIAKAWELTDKYDAGKGSFSNFCGVRIRVADWERERNGRTKWQFADRTYERPRPQFVPLDDRPEQADPSAEMDGSTHRLAAELRLYGAGDSAKPGRDEGLGTESDRVAA